MPFFVVDQYGIAGRLAGCPINQIKGFVAADGIFQSRAWPPWVAS